MTEITKLKPIKSSRKPKNITPEKEVASNTEASFLTNQGPESVKYTVDETDYLVELSQLINKSPSGGMRGGTIAVRMFSLPTGKMVMGIVVSELDDSFIVVMPNAIDPLDGGSLKISSISPSPVARMYKAIVGLTCIPEPKFTLPYLSVVKQNFHKLPGFFNESRSAQIESLIMQLKDAFNEGGVSVELNDSESSVKHKFTPPESLASKVRH